MRETRKLAAILIPDVVAYGQFAGADKDLTLACLRGLRSDLSISQLEAVMVASSSAPATAAH